MPFKNELSKTCGEIPILDMSPLVDGGNIQELAKGTQVSLQRYWLFLCREPRRL